ncbi:hypothetical protein CQW23_21579 [Capsicum baccatum]|uniref:Retrovirus-related Pol polyprotein from transposon TNT 1-94 n=1 Tax=Capsicum baccatum TaxID=33114 RepID=A0A2G2VYF3_CAPBA|nr:hypothetical protein CQW23_21579 [Capsicum baccatum]
MAITEAFKEAIWLKGLFSELSKDLQIITVFYNSQSIIFLMEDQIFHERTRHIDVRYHFVHKIITHGDIVVVFPYKSDIPRSVWNPSLTWRGSPQHKCAARVGVSESDRP